MNRKSELGGAEVAVSICCITYNHGKYIRAALNGFLKQKANFKFEVLIHDDASTDETADIIREYEKKYPEIVKPIYQTENQHSKGLKVGHLNYSRAKGKYIAICEGDDYWIDENKLQKQYDFLEAHPDFSMCCHAALLVDTEGKYIGYGGLPVETGALTEDQVIYEANGWIRTASIFYRTEYWNRPHFFNNLPVGDYPLRLYLFSQGRIWYDSCVMSAYRMSIGKKVNKDSYVYKMKNTKGMRRKERLAMNDFLGKYNDYTSGKYKNAIKMQIDYNYYLIYLDEKNLISLMKNEHFKHLPFRKRIEAVSKVICEPVYNAEQCAIKIIRKYRSI